MCAMWHACRPRGRLRSQRAHSHGVHAHPSLFLCAQLNYRTLSGLRMSWPRFAPSFAERPRVLTAANASVSFRADATRIVADMRAQAGAERAWVLKDVRFARTLPLWHQVLRPHLACIIPIRHPSEVAASSRMRSTDRLKLWRNYVISALASARSIGCPMLLVPYDQWLSSSTNASASAAVQLETLHRFLKCAGMSGLPPSPPYAALTRLIRPAEHHRHAAKLTPLAAVPAPISCLWRRLSALAAGAADDGVTLPKALCGTEFAPPLDD